MAEIDFNKALSREIRTGNELKDFFPPYSHTETKLDKAKDNNDVYQTLEFMSVWAKRYASQMSKIAPLLKGKTIEETVNRIYVFLYSNFQYKLDKEKQYLYSPGAAYYFRATGFDCKSFSIQASCILQMLKIPHSFRMIKQPGLRSNLNPNEWLINPDYWTHVYVVVPNGNKELVIDATKHENIQSNYLAKYDYKMEHLGLNGTYAPAKKQVYGLGCACQGTPAKKTGLGNPSTMAFAVNNFHNFLNELEKQGVSRAVTNNMLGLVRFNVERGIDPDLAEIFVKASQPNGQLGIDFSGIGNQVGTQIGSQIGQFSVGGVSVTQAGQAIAGDPMAIMGIAQGIIGKLGITKFIGSTFGAVFANGFNLSCWGASLTPAVATDRLKKYYSPHFTKLSINIENAQTLYAKEIAINKFLFDVYQMHWFYKVRKGAMTDWSACGKKAIKEVYQKFFDPLKAQADILIADLKSKGATETFTNGVIATYTIPKSSTGLSDYKSGSGATVPYGIPVLNIQKIRVEGQPAQPTQGQPWQVVNNGNGTVTVTQNGASEVMSVQSFETQSGTKAPAAQGGTKTPATPGSSSLTPIVITTGLAIAAKLLFF